MTDRPVIFSPMMVKALLADKKSMTRRLAWQADGSGIEKASPWATVIPGVRLWVREAWRVGKRYDDTKPRDLPPRLMTTLFDAGGSMGGTEAPPKDRHRTAAEYHHEPAYPSGGMPDWAGKRRASFHMCRWASRLTLLVTATKIERLQDISEADAKAEGVDPIIDHGVGNRHLHSIAFEHLWDKLHGPGSWSDNPQVIALTFTVHKVNIDQMRESA